MAQKRRCRHCGRVIHLRPQNPKQHYCSAKVCQNKRKHMWEKEKERRDPEHRASKKDRQRNWAKRQPGYWGKYREEHPEYTRANRERQHFRNRRARRKMVKGEVIAKTDASNLINLIEPGGYELKRVGEGVIAKMDVWIDDCSIITMTNAP